MALGPLDNLDELHNYLSTALQLEHATIPPYLTALYSLHPGTNSDAFHILRTVAVEEMLHTTLVANIMNAVGMSPDLTQPGFVPEYPTYLPSGETDFKVSRQNFCRESVETFLKIERPAAPPPEQPVAFGLTTDTGPHLIARHAHTNSLLGAYKPAGNNLSFGNLDDDTELHFYSIGEFYKEISRGLAELNEKMQKDGKQLFRGDFKNQVTPEYYYSGGGELMTVTDLATAQEAIRLISEQGEGDGGAIFDHEGEISHYYRFQQLQRGQYYLKGDQLGKPSGDPLKIDWDAVYPIKTDA